MKASIADEQLMTEARNGNVRTLGVLFERHQVPLFNYYLRMTGDRAASEDLVQDVFFRILRYRHTYRESTPFSMWMYHIARNARADYMRKARREVQLDPEYEQGSDGAPNAAEDIAARQESALLKKALAALPEEKRELLVLSRYQNLKYEEIARLLECEVGTVKVRVHRAIRELRENFAELAGSRKS
jgi:RNA polymerase sigma-70 factor (ECF subfamily)